MKGRDAPGEREPLLPRVPPEVWESLCRRCGKCCAEKVQIGKAVYMTHASCRFLDPETKGCRVYHDRYRAEPECSSTFSGLPKMLFPADCPYTKLLADYQAPIEDWDDPEVDEAVRELLGEEALPPARRKRPAD